MFMDIVRNCASFAIFFLYMGLAVLPGLLLIYLPHSWPWVQFLYGNLLKTTAKVVLFSTFLPVTYQGFEPLPQRPVIFIANHESALDIPLVASVIESRPYVWVSKSELMQYPILKQFLSHSALLVYSKDSRDHARKGVVEAGVERLKNGCSVMIFPEGGRYTDGTIHPFFSGFAAMAKLSGAPVVPLYISGTGKAMPMGQHYITQAPLIITVGKPMICGQDESVEDFKKRAYDWYVELNWRRDYLLEHYGLRICETGMGKITGNALLQS